MNMNTLSLDDLEVVEYDPSMGDQIADILTLAYMQNNPFVKALELEYDVMFNEFKQQLNSGVFTFNCIVIHKGTRDILGSMFWTEFSKVTIDESITLKNVPSKGEVRKVMKHVTLAPIKKLEKFNNSACALASCFGVNPKYQGLGMTGIIMYFVCLKGQEKGFSCVIGNVINDVVKHLIKKLVYESFDPVDMSDLELVDGSRPLQGLSQQVYVIYLKGTQEFLEKLMH